MPLETGELLRILACPRCLGGLKALEESGETVGLACPACKVVYPVRGDIPIMLDEEAKDRPTWDAGHPQAVERG